MNPCSKCFADEKGRRNSIFLCLSRPLVEIHGTRGGRSCRRNGNSDKREGQSHISNKCRAWRSSLELLAESYARICGMRVRPSSFGQSALFKHATMPTLEAKNVDDFRGRVIRI